MATVAPWSAATARSVSAKATSGWNDPIWVPAAWAGSRTSAPSAPCVDHRLTAVHPDRRCKRRERIVGDRQDDEFDLLDEGLGVDERPLDGHEAPEPLAPTRVAAGDGVDRPAGPGQRHA